MLARTIDGRKGAFLPRRERRLRRGGEAIGHDRGRSGRRTTAGFGERAAHRSTRQAAARTVRGPPHAAAANDAHDALRLEGAQGGRDCPHLGRKLGHAQLARPYGRHDRLLANGVLARLERGKPRTGDNPAVVHFPNLLLFQAPSTIAAMHHPRDAPRRREQANAGGKRRDVAVREPLGACRALLVEVRFRKAPND